MKKVWSLKELHAGFNPVEGHVNGVSLEIQKGERVALLGSQRSGASMLVRVMCGLRPRTSGDLSVFEETVMQTPFYDDWDHIFTKSQRLRMGVSLEKEGLLGNVTIKEGLKTVLRFGSQKVWSDEESRNRLNELLKLFSLENVLDFRPHHLSLAERRFSSFVRAALLDPEVYVIEGPTKGLGDFDKEKFYFACDKLFFSQSKPTLFVATEDLSFARRYCERVMLLEGGKILFDGSWLELQKQQPDYWSGVMSSIRFRDELESPLRNVV